MRRKALICLIRRSGSVPPLCRRGWLDLPCGEQRGKRSVDRARNSAFNRSDACGEAGPPASDTGTGNRDHEVSLCRHRHRHGIPLADSDGWAGVVQARPWGGARARAPAPATTPRTVLCAGAAVCVPAAAMGPRTEPGRVADGPRPAAAPAHSPHERSHRQPWPAEVHRPRLPRVRLRGEESRPTPARRVRCRGRARSWSPRAPGSRRGDRPRTASRWARTGGSRWGTERTACAPCPGER